MLLHLYVHVYILYITKSFYPLMRGYRRWAWVCTQACVCVCVCEHIYVCLHAWLVCLHGCMGVHLCCVYLEDGVRVCARARMHALHTHWRLVLLGNITVLFE